MLEKWATYWKNLYADYRAVAIDVVEDARQRPLKAVFMVSAAAAVTCCAISNPDEKSFKDQILRSASDLILVSPQQQNLISSEHMLHLRNKWNERRLRRLNLLLFSLMYEDKNSSSCCTYDSSCKYIDMSWFDFKDHIIDVGFLNMWWILHHNMKDYDVNYNEL